MSDGLPLTRTADPVSDPHLRLLDEVVSGTPQRFVWLPANDPQAPDVCPDEPAPVAWQRPTPATWPEIIPLCAATRAVIDKVRLDQLRSANGRTSRSHSLLARLKVAAALGLLDGRVEVNDDDWQLAGQVMTVSDATRGRVVEALARQRAEANRARGEDEADRAVLVDERTAEHHVQRVAHNLVQRLRQHGDWVTHGELRRGVTSRDRRWFDDAIGRAVKAGQIEVEQVSGQGESGRRYRAVR